MMSLSWYVYRLEAHTGGRLEVAFADASREGFEQEVGRSECGPCRV